MIQFVRVLVSLADIAEKEGWIVECHPEIQRQTQRLTLGK